MDDYKALAVCWDWTVSTGVHNPLKKGVIVFSSIHYYFLPYSNFYMQFIKEEKTPKKENKNFYKKTRQKKSYKKTRQTKIVQEIFHANKNSCKKTGTKTRTRFFFSNFFFRGHFLVRVRVFVRVFLHEFFFAWTLSCVRVLVSVFSCVFYARVLFCVDAFLYDLFLCVFSLFLVITCHYLAGVKEKLLDDEDHEALMDPSIIKQHSKFLVNLMRSYFGGH